MTWGFIATVIATVLVGPVPTYASAAAPLACELLKSGLPYHIAYHLALTRMLPALTRARSALLQPPWEARGQLVKTMKNMFTGHVPAAEDLSKHAGDFFGDKADHPSKHGCVERHTGFLCAVNAMCSQRQGHAALSPVGQLGGSG